MADGHHENALRHMPFEAVAALSKVAWHESWKASLKRASNADWFLALVEKKAFKDADFHSKKIPRAQEAWNALLPKWLYEPRGQKDATTVSQAILDAAKAAAAHAAARRVGFSSEKKPEKAFEEAQEAWRKFEAAKGVLEEHRDVMSHSLATSTLQLLWASAWHAANSVGEVEAEAAEHAEDEEEEDLDEDEDGEDDEDEGEDDDEDEDEKFGEHYLGSSNDSIEDHVALLVAQRELFWDHSQRWQGCRFFLTSDSAKITSALEAMSKVPCFSGPFPHGLNAARLVLKESLTTAKDPLGDALRAALLKAEALGLRVMLEVQVKPGAKGEQWLKKIAEQAASMKCIAGVALPQAGCSLSELQPLLTAVRAGGLTPDRCQISLVAPQIEDESEESEDGWTPEFRALHKTDILEATQNILHLDGNIIMEGLPRIPPKEEGGPEDAQSLLDAASHAADCIQELDLASSWNLAVPSGIKFKSKDGPTDEWYKEYLQRWLGAVQCLEQGFFFEAWELPEESEEKHQNSEFAKLLESGWVDLAAEDMVIAPTGGKHTHTFIYLHGFMCDAYSYMAEPEFFYKVKKAKKKKGSKAKDHDDEEWEEYEPHPGLKIVLPTAPNRKITAEGGNEHPSWHDYLTDFDGEGEDDLPHEELEAAAARIHAILDREIAAVGAKNVFLGGASQGSAVSLYSAMTYSKGGLGGVFCAEGHLHSWVEIPPEWVATKTPISVYHGLADTTMPWGKWVEATYQRLIDAGCEVTVTLDEGVEHCDGDREQAWTRAFLANAVRPASVKVVAKKAGKKK